MNQLEQLKQFTTVVADTGNFRQLADFAPRDATTNPSLILKAVQDPEYAPLLRQVLKQGPRLPLEAQVDQLLVRFGLEILKVVPGRVSTEIDARLSFDVAGMVARARRVMSLYDHEGMGADRVLIKLAATWEGIQAARILEHEGIHCNLTLLFSLSQAVACAAAGVQLISPFVGRIYDWHKKAAGSAWNEAAHGGANDPGVASVTQIYNYFKKFDISTEIMAASFRHIGQIQALAGCDLLTISPELLTQLQMNTDALPRVLCAQKACEEPIHALSYHEASFRFALNENPMATEKLAEGIRAFSNDAVQLDRIIMTFSN